MTAGTKELYDLGEVPPIGDVPPRMYAQVIRRERFGQPAQAFEREVVPVPEIGADEALVKGVIGIKTALFIKSLLRALPRGLTHSCDYFRMSKQKADAVCQPVNVLALNQPPCLSMHYHLRKT